MSSIVASPLVSQGQRPYQSGACEHLHDQDVLMGGFDLNSYPISTNPNGLFPVSVRTITPLAQSFWHYSSH